MDLAVASQRFEDEGLELRTERGAVEEHRLNSGSKKTARFKPVLPGYNAAEEITAMTEIADPGLPKSLAHVAIRVRDLDRAVDFYRNVVGLDLKRKGIDVAFLGRRTDTSHELALFAMDPNAEGPDETRVGMYHMAWEMGSFAALKAMHERILASGCRIGGYSPVPNQANVMFFDPDGNELEAVWEPTEAEVEAAKEAGGIPKLVEVSA